MTTIVTAGKVIAAKLLNGVDTPTAFGYIAIGSGSTAESASQTALVTEITTNGGARAVATKTYEGSNTAQWSKIFLFTGSVTMREMGVFNASSAGTMLMRHVLAADRAYINGESVEIIMQAILS